LFPSLLPAQERTIDSLHKILEIKKEDTNYVNTLNNLSWALRRTQTDTAIILSTQASALAQKLKFEIGFGRSEQLLGTYCYLMGEYPTALEHMNRSLQLWQRLLADTVYKKRWNYISLGECQTLGNIGSAYKIMGDYTNAIRYDLMALRSAETHGFERNIAVNLGNLGSVYVETGDHAKALDYFNRSLALKNKLGDKEGATITLVNIGGLYLDEKKYDKALEYYLKVKNDFDSLGMLSQAANSLGNIGLVYHEMGRYDEALKYYNMALKRNEEMNDKAGMEIDYGNIGSLYLIQARTKEAEPYLKKALAIALAIGDRDGCKDWYKSFTSLDSLKGDFRAAFDDYKKYTQYCDSLKNEEGVKKQTQLEMQFEFGKKQSADSVRVAEEKKVTAAELKSEKNQRYSLYGGLSLVIVFAGFMFNRFRVTQKQKQVIEAQKVIVEQQKLLVEEKNKDILDSIHYASRIQRSMMPSEKYIASALKRSSRH
jgi:tetratricopeptide (TPR) repeat protein